MKATVRFRIGTLKERAKQIKNAVKTQIILLKNEARIQRMIRKIDFPCAVRFHIASKSVDFYAPLEGWKNDKEFHHTLAAIVKQLEVRMERKFSTFGKNYYWIGENKNGITFMLNDAITPPNCEIVEYTETQVVTKYKSICGKGVAA